MKQNVSMPVVVGIAVAVVAILGFFVYRSVAQPGPAAASEARGFTAQPIKSASMTIPHSKEEGMALYRQMSNRK